LRIKAGKVAEFTSFIAMAIMGFSISMAVSSSQVIQELVWVDTADEAEDYPIGHAFLAGAHWKLRTTTHMSLCRFRQL
jgi:hypothetical protein